MRIQKIAVSLHHNNKQIEIMTTDRNLTNKEILEIFGEHYTMCFNLLDVTINTKNVNKAENLMDNGYRPDEIKKSLPYQNWLKK